MFLVLAIPSALAGQPLLNDPPRSYAIELTAEAGLLGPLAHTVQFDTQGDTRDYVRDGLVHRNVSTGPHPAAPSPPSGEVGA